MLNLINFSYKSYTNIYKLVKIKPLYAHIKQCVNNNVLQTTFKLRSCYKAELNWLLKKGVILGYTLNKKSSLNTAKLYVTVKCNNLINNSQIEFIINSRFKKNDT